MPSPGRRGSLVPAFAFTLLVVLPVVLPVFGCASSPPPPPAAPAAAAPAAAATATPTAAPPGPTVGPMLRLIPAAEARPQLMASISLPSFDRTLSGAVALLSRAVPLPLDAAGVKETLLTQAGLPPKVGENLDTASPAGAVVVAIGGKEVGGLVMAIPAKGVEQARVVIGALGTIVARRGEIVQIDNGSGGRGWVWQSAGVIVLSDSIDALARGAMLALEARRPGTGEDVTAVLYPASIARANGTDLKTALTTMVAMARAMRAAQAIEAQSKIDAEAKGKHAGAARAGAPLGAGTDHSLDVLEDVAGYLGDTSTVEIGLTTSEARGLMVNVRIHPLPGTPFEKLTAEGTPFSIDPALLRKPDRKTEGKAEGKSDGAPDEIAFVAASSYGPFLRAQIARQRQRLADSHEKGAAAALAFFDTSFASFTGTWSGVGRLRPTLSVQAIYPLKDDASAAKLSAAMAEVDTAAAVAFMRSQLAPDQQGWFDLKAKRETVGKLKTLHYTLSLDAKRLPPATRDAVKKLLGASAFDIYLAVSGMRAVVAGGKDAKARLADLTRAPKDKGAAGQAADTIGGDLGDAILAAKGKDSFFYFDLGPVVTLVGALADEPRTKALAASCSAPIPTYATFTSDGQAKQMTFSWTVPPSAFVGAGAIIQGLGSAGASQSP